MQKNKNSISNLLKSLEGKLEDHRGEYDTSIRLDFFIKLKDKNPIFETYLKKIALEIIKSNGKKKPTQNDYKVFLKALRVILLNLAKTTKYKLRTAVRVSLNGNSYSKADRYTNDISYRQFMVAYNGLIRLELIKVVGGGCYNQDEKSGLQTRIFGTEDFLKTIKKIIPPTKSKFGQEKNRELIILRNGNPAKEVNYNDTAEIKKMRTNLDKINKLYSKHCIDLAVNNKEYNEMCFNNLSRREDPIEHSMLGDICLVRIFSNGDFTQGGRFYGVWWQTIPSFYRKYITINCEPTVEIDYSCFHASILYSIEGINYQDDAYTVEIDGIKDKELARDMAKLAFNILINSEDKVKQPKEYEESKVGVSWINLVKAIRLKHKNIAKHFNTGIGIRLQRQDSDLAERILLHFLKQGIVCLSVHDSFIVPVSHKEELIRVMQKEYRKAFKTDCRYKIEESNISSVIARINKLIADKDSWYNKQ